MPGLVIVACAARYILYIVATGIHASRDIPYILYIVATGIHASRDIPYILYIKNPGGAGVLRLQARA
ncbi:MAG: hypothetical protein KDI16_14790 [Halioglobus sp.]|nr:hypothetical protein [Halioglobus sp.]